MSRGRISISRTHTEWNGIPSRRFMLPRQDRARITYHCTSLVNSLAHGPRLGLEERRGCEQTRAEFPNLQKLLLTALRPRRALLHANVVGIILWSGDTDDAGDGDWRHSPLPPTELVGLRSKPFDWNWLSASLLQLRFYTSNVFTANLTAAD
jgi:hypothetical protein